MSEKRRDQKPIHEMDERERNSERNLRLTEIVSRLMINDSVVERRGDTIFMRYQGLVLSIHIDERDPRLIIIQTAFQEGEPDLIRAVLSASKATDRSFGAKATIQGNDQVYTVKISYESFYPTVDDLFAVIGLSLSCIVDCRENYISERTGIGTNGQPI